MLWSGAAYLAGPAVQLLVAPYLIRHLGSEIYGVLLLVNSVILMSSLSSFGLGDATVKYVAEYVAHKRSKELVMLLQTTLLLYLILGGLTVVALNLLAPFLAEHAFNVSPEYRHDATVGIRIGSVSLLLSLIYSVGQSLCRGLRRYDVESSTGILGSLLGPACSCLLVSRGYGLAAVIATTCGAMCLNNVVLGWRGSRLLGTAVWLVPKFRWDMVRRLASYGFFGWLQMVEWVLINQADRFIVSSVLGPAAVTPYAICVQIMQLASGVVIQAFGYLFPLATELYVKQRWSELKRVYLTGMQLTSIASLSVGALMFVYGQTILFVWMGNNLGDYDHKLILVLASATAMLGTTIVPSLLLNGAGRVRLNAAFTMSSMAAVLPCSLVFLHFFGLVGMGFGKLMNVFPGLIARIIIGRIILKDRRILICFWHLLPTLGGLGVLWGGNLRWQLTEHAAAQPGVALGIVLGSIATTTLLTVLVYQPEINRLKLVSDEPVDLAVPTLITLVDSKA